MNLEIGPDAPGSSLSKRVIGAAINVHRELGPGFLESVYENALCVEIERVGILYERQTSVPILYHGIQVGEHRLDLLIEKKLVVELKTVQAVDPVHFAVGRSYLRATGLRDGLILNFAVMPLGIHRVAPHSLPSRGNV